MLGTAIFLERDECGSIPVIRCFPAGSHAPAAETCSSGYGWDGCDTPCTVQHRIRNCVLRSAGKILEEPGRMLQQCCTFRTQLVLYVLAAELFAGCPNPSDAAAPKKIAIANVLVSSLLNIDFTPS